MLWTHEIQIFEAVIQIFTCMPHFSKRSSFFHKYETNGSEHRLCVSRPIHLESECAHKWAYIFSDTNDTTVFSFLILYATKHRYIPSSSIPGLFSGSFWQITTLNVAIFRHRTLPSAYWFQIKLQYFHSSISVHRCCATHLSSAHATHTHMQAQKRAQWYTHLLFLLGR